MPEMTLIDEFLVVSFDIALISIDICCSSIAQLVEQMTVNHWVTGSSPVRGANIISLLPLVFSAGGIIAA